MNKLTQSNNYRFQSRTLSLLCASVIAHGHLWAQTAPPDPPDPIVTEGFSITGEGEIVEPGEWVFDSSQVCLDADNTYELTSSEAPCFAGGGDVSPDDLEFESDGKTFAIFDVTDSKWVGDYREETNTTGSGLCGSTETATETVPCFRRKNRTATHKCYGKTTIQGICESGECDDNEYYFDETDQTCKFYGTGSSVLLNFNLGRSKGRQNGYLRSHHSEPTPLLFSVNGLEIKSLPAVDILRNPDFSIRQILSPVYLLTIEQDSEDSYTVAFYMRPQELNFDQEGWIIPQGDILHSITVRRPAGSKANSVVEVLEKIGKQTRKMRYQWDAEEKGWQYWTEESGLRRSIRHYSDPVTGIKLTERTLSDEDGQLVSKETLQSEPWNNRYRHVLKTKEDAAGNILEEYTSYYQTPDDPARHGKLKSNVAYDGSWTAFGYDDRGRGAYMIEPWKDSPLTLDPKKAKTTYYDTYYLKPEDAFYHPQAEARVERVEILGIPVSKTIRVESTNRFGGRVTITEDCLEPTGKLGDEGNRRAVTIYYPEREHDPASGRVKSSWSSSGTLTRHRYTRGEFLGAQAMPGDFVPDPSHTKKWTKVERWTTPNTQPEGILHQTTKEISIYNRFGKLVYNETRLLSAPGEFDTVVSWTGHHYDDRARRILTRDQTGIIAEYRYNDCCNKIEWQRDRNGVVTNYKYDVLNRVTAKVEKVPGQAQKVTHYQYDTHGNITSTVVASSGLELVTKSVYDGFGELVSRTGTDGLNTTYLRAVKKRQTTTTLPNGATHIETTYLDGQTKSVTGTAVVAQYYDYGVEEQGYRWSEAITAKPEGPRWNRSYSDALGRVFRTENPSPVEGYWIASLQKHDTQGRVIASGRAWTKSPQAAGGADGLAEAERSGLIGPNQLFHYDKRSGELLMSGADVDRDNKLKPGTKDQISSSQTRYQEIGGHWYQVAKTWTYPQELKGERYLASESRRRITGLGDRDEKLGVLISESVTKVPTNREGELLATVTKTYRDRETSTLTTVTISPTGIVTKQVSKAGQLQSVETSQLAATTPPRSGGIPAADSKAQEQQSPSALKSKASSLKPDQKITYQYDALGRRIAVTDPRIGTSRSIYDPKTGRLTHQIDPEKRSTEIRYYARGHKSAGQVSSRINPDGKTTRYAYNERGQQTGIWGDTQYPIAYDYNDYGERVGMRTFHLTPEGDPSLEENKSARTTWTYHEATGALLKKTYADGKGPEYRYDKTGQLIERKWARSAKKVGWVANPSPEPTRPPVPSPEPNGNKKPITGNQEHLSTNYQYHEITGALLKTTYADGNEITYQYDDSNRLKKVTAPTGTREFTYNIRGQILTETVEVGFSPEAGGVSKEEQGAKRETQEPHSPSALKSKASRLKPGKSRLKPLKYRITRTYTPEGHPDKIQLTGLDGLDLTHQIDYDWNARGQLAKVTSPAGEFSYTYNQQNPILLDRITAPAHQVQYAYEPHRNLITSVKNSPIPMQNGSEAQISLPSKVSGLKPVSHYSYKNDILGRRTQIAQRGTAFQLLQLHGQNSIQVAYNDRGEVTNYQITSKAPPRSGDTPVAGQPEPKPTSLINQTYQFDAIGNRVRFASEDRGQKSEVSYQTNALNQYTLIGEEGEKVRKGEGEPGDGRLSHDPDGNLLEDRQNRYTWSAENRLIKVESKDGSSKVEYTYDYQGRRTTKKQSTKNREPRTTIYLYDGWNLLAELESAANPRSGGIPTAGRAQQLKNSTGENGAKQQQSPPALKSKASSLKPDAKASSLKSTFYTWGRDLSGSLQGAGGVGGLLAITTNSPPHQSAKALAAAEKQADTHLYPCYDANGNIGQMISPKAEIKAAYQYDAFGRTVDQGGEKAEENQWRFSTKPQEEQTGWYYYGFRYYDPQTGRWPSRDPIEEEGGVNLYGFVANSGIGKWDYIGREEGRLTPRSTFKVTGGPRKGTVAESGRAHWQRRRFEFEYDSEKKKIKIKDAQAWVSVWWDPRESINKPHELRHVEDMWIIWKETWRIARMLQGPCISETEYNAILVVWRDFEASMMSAYRSLAASRHGDTFDKDLNAVYDPIMAYPLTDPRARTLTRTYWFAEAPNILSTFETKFGNAWGVWLAHQNRYRDADFNGEDMQTKITAELERFKEGLNDVLKVKAGAGYRYTFPDEFKVRDK